MEQLDNLGIFPLLVTHEHVPATTLYVYIHRIKILWLYPAFVCPNKCIFTPNSNQNRLHIQFVMHHVEYMLFASNICYINVSFKGCCSVLGASTYPGCHENAAFQRILAHLHTIFYEKGGDAGGCTTQWLWWNALQGETYAVLCSATNLYSDYWPWVYFSLR